MNIVLTLLLKYLDQEKFSFGVIILLIVVINILQTNYISSITSTIIDSVEHGKIANAFSYYRFFIGITLVYLVVEVFKEIIEMNLLTKLTPWLRTEFFTYLLRSNNEEMTQSNVVKYNMPIGRVSYSATSFLNQIISNFITNLAFVVIISGYFIYKHTLLGVVFLVSNVMLVGFIAYVWDWLMEYKHAHEYHSNATEFYSLDVFTNFDKIIYRGQSEKEIGEYSEHNRKSQETGLAFHQQSSLLQLALVVFLYLIILGSIWYLIMLKSTNQIDTKTFITFFTIILLYRDKITSILQMIPNCMEIQGRIKYVIDKFDELPSELQIDETPKYKEVSLPFDEIRFENVSYKYNSGSAYVLENLNLTIHTDGKIIGLTGPSGRGKSTVMKLLLKLYKYDKGIITIDGVDISTISPNYIRENITYVNQTAKLFDKPIMDNMMYGCKESETCQSTFDNIMKYPAVQKLYANIDFKNKTAGALGEHLSGGQRQIVNILSGLVNPSKILILDEPTNALDADLKRELLGIIDAFRQYKKCIIIITHDRDVYPLFDERIKI